MSLTKSGQRMSSEPPFIVGWMITSELVAQASEGNTLLADTELGKRAHVCGACLNTNQ